MRNENNRGKSGKGYYIALILCAAAIGITSYVTRPKHEKEPEKPSLMETDSTAPVRQTEKNVEALATQEPEEIGVPAPSSVPPAETEAPALKTAAPTSSQGTNFYAMENLSYNETTRDWRVHNGVDYPGSEGEPVCAAADGTVVTVREDDLLGTTVVLRHRGGYETTYQCLGAEVSVKPGDTVVLGQTIGCVGTTALTETAIGPHLHFSVSCQGTPMDPEEFLKLG